MSRYHYAARRRLERSNYREQERGAARDAGMSSSQHAVILRGLLSRIKRLGLTEAQAMGQIGVANGPFYAFKSDGLATPQFLGKVSLWLRATRQA